MRLVDVTANSGYLFSILCKTITTRSRLYAILRRDRKWDVFSRKSSTGHNYCHGVFNTLVFLCIITMLILQ